MDSAHSVFTKLSKVLIIFPIALIAVTLVLKTSSPSSKADNNEYRKLMSITPVSSTKTPTPAKIKLNLKGPSICSTTVAGKEITAKIKNKKIYAEVTQNEDINYYLLQEDYLYHWQKDPKTGKTTGDKTPGMSAIVGSLEMLSQLNLLDINSLISTVFKSKQISSVPTQLTNLDLVCKDAPSLTDTDQSFKLPSGVVFKESSTLPNIGESLKLSPTVKP